MGKSGRRDDEILARVRERFPSDAASRRELAVAVKAAAASLGEIVGAFCRQAGMSKAEVAAVFRELSEAAATRELRLEPGTDHLWHQVADVVTRWWRDPVYLTDDSRPRDLPETGPAPSIEALLEETVSPASRADAKALLRRTCVVEPGGLWHYCDEDGGFLRLSAEHGVDRLRICVSGMFKTYLDNALRRRDLRVTKNFDKTAMVQAYPMALVPQLRAKVLKRLEVGLQDVDELLVAGERREVDGPVAMVGVTMVMHVSEPRPRAKKSPVGDDATTSSTSKRRAAKKPVAKRSQRR